MAVRKQHCFNCGEFVGEFDNFWRDIVSCGSPECEREARDQERYEHDRMQEDAREDGYERYR